MSITPRLKPGFSFRKTVYAIIGLPLVLSWLISGWSPFPLRVVRSEAASGSGTHRSLSFEERVRYQRAIEEVYWRHTAWPQQSDKPKPDLGAVSPLETTRAKVEDTLRKSEALEQLWGHPVTAEQLQAEMDRMAQESKQPGILRELCQALNNDPFLVAEVLARPILVERLARNFYAHDSHFHGDLRKRAEEEAQGTLAEMRLRGDTFSEAETIKVTQAPTRRFLNIGNNDGGVAQPASEGKALRLMAPEWDAETARLEAMFSAPKETTATNGKWLSAHGTSAKLRKGSVSGLQEDADSFYVASVTEKTDSRLKIARVEWRKARFDLWWSKAQNSYAVKSAPVGDFHYRLAKIPQASSSADDTWNPTKALPVTTGTVVWTGTEMIIWGGQTIQGGTTNSGARYNPATDTWVTISTTNAPRTRRAHSAIWTGTEMIVWGGCDLLANFCGLADGGRYNPVTDTWTPTSNTNAPRTRRAHSAVWTGSKMIIWGGCAPGNNNQCNITLNTGGIYDPASDSWTPTSTVNAPSPRNGHKAVWTGTEMIVWGPTKTGGRYNPATDTWTPINTFNAPSDRNGFTMIWTGTEVIVWGGYENNFIPVDTSARYNPSTDTWTPTSDVGAPAPRFDHTAVWTGSEMIIYGGQIRNASNNLEITKTGGRYNPATDSWTATSTLNAPPKTGHVAVWTGTEMIVWSADGLKEGGRYNPSSDSWVATDNNDSAPPVELGVWTGTEMIVWGRSPGCGSGCPSSGGRYNPATYSWKPMSTGNAPSPGITGRAPTAIWTGKEMIVWGAPSGGYGSPGDGGRYNPLTDSWVRTSKVNAPSNRAFHTAVWTGSEMIVWGGESSDGTKPDIGGRYDPGTDTWTPTSTAGAPGGRYIHSAVWTGSEMIVWGGVAADGTHLSTGGRYNPSTNSWTPVSNTSAPSERRYHTAIWTGSEMVIWGGRTGDYNSNSGLLNTGGRYNPATDTWQSTSPVGAPSARFLHSTVWTGSLMIVWGGRTDNGLYVQGSKTGARYNPLADAWTPTSTLHAPSDRYSQIALWTGTGMIVWGGVTENGAATHGAIYNAPGASTSTNPPFVSILSPTEGQTFQSGDNISFNLNVSDSDGSITAVYFYANDALIGTKTTAPFNFTWNEVHGGSYSLTAVASDNNGGVTTSAPVHINVTPSSAPPVCTLTSPANGATYTAPATIPIAANAQANRDRTISKIEFFAGDLLLDTQSGTPHSFNWGGLDPGTYNLSVRCTDSAGAATTSATSTITVSPTPSTVRITGQIGNLQNIRVRLDSSQSPTPQYTTTNLLGVYQFGSLPSGANYTVTPESDVYSFAPASRSYTAMSQNDDDANFGATRIGYSISGHITDASGNPIHPVTVNLSGSKTATTGTDANGNYFFSNLAPGGNYTIQPYKNQYNFTPPYRTINNLSADQSADFSGAPKSTPALTWNKPADISYGMTLSTAQLNATASVPGSFTYTPTPGTQLGAGAEQTLTVTFTPTDADTYNSVTQAVQINVMKAAPTMTWSNPADITYGTALSAGQLNATASVAGTVTYTLAAGTILEVGNNQTLTANFTPTDTTNYSSASKNVSINVLKATPTITWNNPADIAYGTALTAAQLNATGSVPGTVTFTPATGTVLNVGNNQTLMANFTPTDTAHYNSISKNVSINVVKALPTVTWNNPTEIIYGTGLSATQLNAVANVPGTFTYNPPTGTILPVGSNLPLFVTFAPTDTTNYGVVSTSVLINVKAPAFLLMTEENSQQAAALDALTLLRGPFPVVMTSPSGQVMPTRIMIFAKDLNLQAGEDVSSVKVEAEDSLGKIYQLEVEAAAKVSSWDWLTQINLKLPAELAGAGDVWVRVKYHEQSSNRALVSIKP